MRTTVRAPDGGYITVEHPQGASDEDILDYAKKNYTKPTPIKLGMEGFSDAAKQVAAETGPVGRFLQGAGETFDRYAYGAKGLFTDLSPEEKLRLEQNKIMSEQGGLASSAGQVAGDVAISAPAFAAGGAVAAPAVRAVLPRALPRAMAQFGGAAGGGAAAGALSSPEDRTGGALAGGIGGAAGYGLGQVAARMLGGPAKPLISKEAAELQARGVEPTIGQAADQGTLVGRSVRDIEERVAGLPVIGAPIRAARKAAEKEFEEATIAQTLKPVVPSQEVSSVAKTIAAQEDPVAAVAKRIGEVYDEALANRALGPQAMEIVKGRVPQIIGSDERFLSRAQKADLQDYADEILGRFDETGALTAENAKKVSSALRHKISVLLSAPDPEKRELGHALVDLQSAWREAIASGLPQRELELLGQADTAWRQFVALRTASRQGGASAGPVTAARLTRATAKARMAEDEELRRLAKAGQAVLPSKTPDSGTAGRVAIPAAIVGGIVDPLTTLAVTGGSTAGTALGYTRPVQRALMGRYGLQPKLERMARSEILRRGLADTATEAGDNERLRAALIGAAR